MVVGMTMAVSGGTKVVVVTTLVKVVVVDMMDMVATMTVVVKTDLF